MAFTNAKIYVTPTQVINNGTPSIQNGKVVQVGKSVTIPKNAVVENLEGNPFTLHLLMHSQDLV